MAKCRFPRFRERAPLLRFKRPTLRLKERRLESALTIGDLRLLAGGRDGVDRTIEILKTEIVRTMKLLGVRSVAELNPGHMTQLERLTLRRWA